MSEIQHHSLVLLNGASGFGKTSVALALKEELKKDNELVVGYVSFREVKTEWDLVKRYVEAMFTAMGIPDYRWGLIDECNFNTQFLVDFYEKPTEYAKRLGKKLIAIVDDFEAVYGLPHADVIEARFRGTWQPDASDQKYISAIVLQNINNDTLTYFRRKRALAATGTMLLFERISLELWTADIKGKFAVGNKSIDEDVIVYLIEKMNHIPRRIQSLCHHLFLTKSKVITRQLVDKAIVRLLENVSWLYEARLGLLSKLQQATLFSYVDKTEIKIPPLKHSKIYLSMDEFVFYYDSKRVFRDPFLEAYLLKRNNINTKRFSKKWENVKESGKGKNFDSKEWTWE